jgi:hypothetical protein
MLICDGHGSHATTEFMWAAFCANIHLVFLPPHCSHVLQPLDVNFFGILKGSYRKQIQDLSQLKDDLKLKKKHSSFAIAKLERQYHIYRYRKALKQLVFIHSIPRRPSYHHK